MARYAQNDWGLYDVSGNVWEWANDWYDKDYYKNSPETDPQGPRKGNSKVFRGGSWRYDDPYLRCSYRNGGVPGGLSIGFRCVREVFP